MAGAEQGGAGRGPGSQRVSDTSRPLPASSSFPKKGSGLSRRWEYWPHFLPQLPSALQSRLSAHTRRGPLASAQLTGQTACPALQEDAPGRLVFAEELWRCSGERCQCRAASSGHGSRSRRVCTLSPCHQTRANSRKHNVGIQLSCCSCSLGILPKPPCKGYEQPPQRGKGVRCRLRHPPGLGAPGAPLESRAEHTLLSWGLAKVSASLRGDPGGEKGLPAELQPQS